MISDGRDTPPRSAADFISQLQAKFKQLGVGAISTISGRAYGMDRDNNWTKTEKFYKAISGQLENNRFSQPEEVLQSFYDQDLDDEKIIPSIIDLDTDEQFISDHDGVIIFNFRADRARQLTRVIGDPNLDDFNRDFFAQDLCLATMTPYEEDWKMEVNVVFSPPKADMPLPKMIYKAGLSQYHLAESEKKAHVTYFFNGGYSEKYERELDTIISSPDVESYDLKPEMSLPILSQALTDAIKKSPEFIVTNFANPDMVGHTGNFEATLSAIEVVDQSLGLVIKIANKAGYRVIVTADHGNAEQMINPASGKPDKEHTINPVPFFLIDNYKDSNQNLDSDRLWQTISQLQPSGILADVTATILSQLEIEKPEMIIGENLEQALVTI
jgi:2,3-bisphosphoglycerate-independent phosphoglycerate mutase